MNVLKKDEIKKLKSEDVREILDIGREELGKQEKALPLLTLAKKYSGIIATLVTLSVLDRHRIEQILISLSVGLGAFIVFYIAEKLTEKSIYEIERQIEELEKFWR